MKKKILATILMICVAITSFRVNMFADNEPKAIDTVFGADGIQYKVTSIGSPNTVEVTKNTYYSNNDLIIPSNITDENGVSYTVTRIGNQAFRYNDYFSSVTLPNTILSIGEEAFECCDGFSEITIPDSVTIIETAAFQQCMNLATVNISSSSNLETISDRAFMSSEAIHSLTIPASVTSIGESPFYGLSLEISFLGTTPPTLSHPLNDKTFNWCTISNIYVPTDALATYRLALKEEGSYYNFENKVQKVPSTSDEAISYILPDDFPDRNDLLHWQNSNKANLSIDEYGFLWFDKGELNDRPFVTCDNLMASEIDNGNYSYSDAARNSGDNYTFTFVMNAGTLASITVEGFTNDYAVFNGSYQMQDYPTVEELLAKSVDTFPTSKEEGWASYYYGYYLYVEDNNLKLYNSTTSTTRVLTSINTKASIDNGYFILNLSPEEKLCFYFDSNDKLYEIEIDDAENNCYYYPPEETTTLAELFGGLDTAFPTSLADAWTDYNGYSAFIDDNKLVIHDSNGEIESVNLSREVVVSYGYTYFKLASNASLDITFADDNLKELEYIEYDSNDYCTYFYPKCDLLMKFAGIFPNGDIPWTNDENGTYMMIDNLYELNMCFVVVDSSYENYDYVSETLFEMILTPDDNSYISNVTGYDSEANLTYTFNLNEDNLIESITVSGYDGDYEIFNGTYKTPLLLADVLPDNFPTCDDYNPQVTWKNEDGTELYGIERDGEIYNCFEKDDYILEGRTPFEYLMLQKVLDNNYVAYDEIFDYENDIYGIVEISLIINDGIATSMTIIIVDGLSSDYDFINGTYILPPTIAEVIATAEEGFPTTAQTGWSNENGIFLYADSNSIYAIKDGVSIGSIDTSEELNKDYEFNFLFDEIVKFNLDKGTLRSITISGCTGSLESLNGDYYDRSHGLVITKMDNGKEIKANEGEDADYYWSDKLLHILNSDLIVSSNSKKAEEIRIHKNATSLTLKNINLNGEISIFNNEDNVDFTLNLIGTNQIGNSVEYSESTTYADYSCKKAIDFSKNLYINGSGSLIIYDSSEGFYSEDSDLIFMDTFTGTITVKDGGFDFEEQPPEDEPPCAISIGTNTLTINGGTLNLTSYQKNGITAGSVTINGGKLTVKGGIQAMSIAPVLDDSVKVTKASENFDGLSPVETYSESEIANYKYIEISDGSSPTPSPTPTPSHDTRRVVPNTFA